MITSYFQKKKSSLSEGDSQPVVSDYPSAHKRMRTDEAEGPFSTKKSASDKHERIMSEPARALISHLTEDSWSNALRPYVTQASFASLAQFVENERYDS